MQGHKVAVFLPFCPKFLVAELSHGNHAHRVALAEYVVVPAGEHVAVAFHIGVRRKNSTHAESVVRHITRNDGSAVFVERNPIRYRVPFCIKCLVAVFRRRYFCNLVARKVHVGKPAAECATVLLDGGKRDFGAVVVRSGVVVGGDGSAVVVERDNIVANRPEGVERNVGRVFIACHSRFSLIRVILHAASVLLGEISAEGVSNAVGTDNNLQRCVVGCLD